MENTDDSKQLREMIRVLERKLGILQEGQFSCCGITMSQCHALVEIGRAESICLNDLAKILNLENNTMSRTVSNLAERKLAKREINPQDRRYLNISLTDKGYKHYKNIEEDMNQYFNDIYEAIPENKKQQVLESLEILIEAIDKNKCCK